MIQPKSFPLLAQIDGLDQTRVQEHLHLYQGYIKRGRQLLERWQEISSRARQGTFAQSELHSLKVDFTYAMSAIKNHELYFDVLGRPPEVATARAPRGDLLKTIESDFGGLEQLLADLRLSAMDSHGWAWLTLDLDRQFLFCYGGNRQHALPVWNTIPIIALDLYVHAYAYDFGTNKGKYINVLLENLNWDKVALRYEHARQLAGLL